MNEDKNSLPPSISWEMHGTLLPIEWDWVHIMEQCKIALTNERQYVILPFQENQNYIPQRSRLIKEDKTSPSGLIQRDHYALERYYPYACARFDAEELVRYAAKRFNDLTDEELTEMASKSISQYQTME
jgi:hypothetical protein